MKMNRWFIAMAAVGIHICIGSVYAWSVLTKPVMQTMGLTLSQTTWAFSVAILFLGLSAGFLGGIVERMGPKKSGILSACFFSVGLIGTAFAIQAKSVSLLYIFYGFIGGIGLGTGYITPVSTLVKWFPSHRGFATGLAIMGFGFAALVAGPTMQYLTVTYGVMNNFFIMGGVYFVVMILSATVLRAPRKGEVESSAMVLRSEGVATINRPALSATSMNRKEALHTWMFYALWFIFFINITCGIGLLAVVSPMAQEVIGMSSLQAASLVGIVGIVNGGGRIAWSTVSDWIGRDVTYLLFFVIEIIAFWCLSITTNSVLFQCLVLLIISCYGGGFSCMPAFLSDLFGVKQLASIHGSILTAWGIAGVVGPVVLALMKESTGGYVSTLHLFSFMLGSALLVTLGIYGSLVRRKNRELVKQEVSA